MKKIKTLWARLFKRRKYLTIDTTGEKILHVIEVDETTNSLTNSLGMSDERAEYLFREVHKAYIEHNNVVAVAVAVSKHCKHANELYYVSHIIANKQRDVNNPMKLLNEIFGRQRDDN